MVQIVLMLLCFFALGVIGLWYMFTHLGRIHSFIHTDRSQEPIGTIQNSLEIHGAHHQKQTQLLHVYKDSAYSKIVPAMCVS